MGSGTEGGWGAADVAIGTSVFAGELALPVMVLKESALDNNLRVMAAYARAHGFDLAPHGKTTMAPELFRRQLEAGAWGITVANMAQAGVAFAAGAARVLVANEIVGTADAAGVVDAVKGGDHELLCLVDSVYGARLLDANLGRAGMIGRLGVLVELGIRGGRTGARSEQDVFDVVAALSASAHLRLVGVEGYEGGIAADRSVDGLAQVDSYLDGVRRTVRALADQGSFAEPRTAVVSAGGSKFFDRVAAVLGPAGDYGGHPVRLIVRAGCYVTHDHGMYETVSPLASSAAADHLVAALEALGRGPLRPRTGPRHRRPGQTGHLVRPRPTCAPPRGPARAPRGGGFHRRCPGGAGRPARLFPIGLERGSQPRAASPRSGGPDRLRALAPLHRLRQVADRPAGGRRLYGAGADPDLFPLIAPPRPPSASVLESQSLRPSALLCRPLSASTR